MGKLSIFTNEVAGMNRFLVWLLRPVINTILDERKNQRNRRFPPLTEAEVIEQKNEFLRAMGPVFGAPE